MMAENIQGLPVTLKVSSLIYYCNYHWQEASTTAAKNSIIYCFTYYIVAMCPPVCRDLLSQEKYC